jgi:hypothetical protein
MSQYGMVHVPSERRMQVRQGIPNAAIHDDVGSGASSFTH